VVGSTAFFVCFFFYSADYVGEKRFVGWVEGKKKKALLLSFFFLLNPRATHGTPLPPTPPSHSSIHT
jgi:hypothetical protein